MKDENRKQEQAAIARWNDIRNMKFDGEEMRKQPIDTRPTPAPEYGRIHTDGSRSGGQPPQPAPALADDLVAEILRDVCSLPDYTSPDDQPDLLQCTVEELQIILERNINPLEAQNKALRGLEALLREAVERIEAGDLDQRMCCGGHMCGCQGSTNADHFLHFAREALQSLGGDHG